MPNMTTQTQARPIFSARLTPRRSIGARGAGMVVAVLAIAATMSGAIYFSLGAWPIIAFLVLDVALLGLAMGQVLRRTKREEEVTLWSDQLELKQVDTTGRATLTRFHPQAVKLVIDRDFNERTTALHLRSADQDVELGAFLEPDEKSSFAKAFGTALRRARG